jgi:superfamily II DNA or RNA helicase
MIKTLRDYQGFAITGGNGHLGILPSLEQHKSTLLVLPTGTGKTVVISKVATDWPRGNILCLAHRIELVDQMAATLAVELGYEPIIEQSQRGADPMNLWQGGLVVCGSIQSMISRKRVEKYRVQPFGLIIVDEAHRATSPSYTKLIECYTELDPELRVLGVTATPNRTDGTALGLVFESVAYQMDIWEGIDAGWLVDIHQKFCVLGEIDFSTLRMTKNEFGEADFKQADLERVLTEEKILHEMSHPLLDMTQEGQQAIVFCASVPHAHLWSMVLNRYRSGCSKAVDAETDTEERKRIVQAYKNGELQFLLNYDVFSEGFDAPTTSMVVMGRPTKSLLKYTQMLGRGTRPLSGVVDGVPTIPGRKDAIAASGKPFLTVLDFVGNSRHKIISAADVLGGNYDVDIREAANGLLGNKPGNVREAINKAKAAAMLAMEERKRDAIKFSRPDYQIQDVGAFDARGVGAVQEKLRGGATDGQVSFLINLGIDREDAYKMGQRQAGAVINDLKQKRCTIKQASILRKYGLNPGEFNVDSASAMIDEIKDNGWKWP